MHTHISIYRYIYTLYIHIYISQRLLLQLYYTSSSRCRAVEQERQSEVLLINNDADHSINKKIEKKNKNLI